MEVIAIVGPTAVGKTKLSIALAKKYNGEIINADSTQIYKNLDIATAKIKEEEKENIVHHLLSIKNIDEDYTVYDYQKDCRKKIKEIKEKGKLPIIVGGTGLYIKAALYDYQFIEEKKQDYSKYKDEELFALLKEKDPDTLIHPHNRKRVERALTYYYQTHKPFSKKEKNEKLLYKTLFIGLTTDRKILYEKINQRVDIMIKDGLLKEAKKIYDTPYRTKAVMTPIGYKEFFPYFEGKEDLNICIDKIKQNSRRYAKRQYTWFSHQIPVIWFETNYDHFKQTIDSVEEFLEKQ